MDEREKRFRPADVLVAGVVIVGAVLVLTASMARGREHAKRVLCDANLIKYHAAMSRYLSDNDERYCESFYCTVNGNLPVRAAVSAVPMA